MHAFLKTALVAAAMVSVLSVSAFAVGQNSITVQGQGEIKVEPDTAFLSVGVKSEAKTVGEAQSANAQTVAQVKSALTTLNITKQNVKTSGYNVAPEYEYPANSKAVLAGYVVRYTLQVRVTDMTKIGTILDAVGVAGANEIGNISFTSSRANQLKLDALKLAVADAKVQADAIASASSRSLRQALHITSQSTRYAPVMAAPAMARSAGVGGSPTPTEVDGGQITVSASVTAEFEF